MSDQPILYSFRRCPYAMRARMALLVSETPVRLREVVLRDKPEEMLAASPKGTVPVLLLSNGEVIDESLAIMQWALARNDPQGWLDQTDEAKALIAENDGEFKQNLDRYKYPTRYENVDPVVHRAAGLQFLRKLDGLIAENGQIQGKISGIADHAIFPFVRQFANNDRNWFDELPLKNLQTWLQGHLVSEIFVTTMTKFDQWKTGEREPIFAASI